MARRGESKTQKSISAPIIRHFNRKETVFTVKGRPGPHSNGTSVPLSFLLREVLGVASTVKECKKILSEGSVKINGKQRKKLEFPAGIFDLVEIAPIKKKYRLLLDTKGRLKAKEIDYKAADFKVSKIVAKRAVKGGKIMLTTNDGYSLDMGSQKIQVDDSVKLSLPALKIEAVYGPEKGNTAFLVAGVHVGKTLKVEGVVPGDTNKEKSVTLSEEGKQFETVLRNVFVVGKEKAEIEALK